MSRRRSTGRARHRRDDRRRQDAWGRRARAEGYAARSVYKLQEIQRRTGVLRPGARVVDLGCYPGSWSRYAREVIGPGGVLVGVDPQGAPEGVEGTWFERPLEEVPPEAVLEALGGPADVLLSDMAPRTTGDRFGDHVRQVALVRRALALAERVVAPGGAAVVKVFDGAEVPELRAELGRAWERVRRIKPQATRGRSVEFYFVATGRRAA